MPVSDDLIEAYDVLSDLTRPMCDACPTPQEHRCCYREACQMAQMVAEGLWGERLEPDGDQLPYLTAGKGCSAAPHLRPHCTAYVCPEALAQACPEDQQEYADLRAYIARLERQRR